MPDFCHGIVIVVLIIHIFTPELRGWFQHVEHNNDDDSGKDMSMSVYLDPYCHHPEYWFT